MRKMSFEVGASIKEAARYVHGQEVALYRCVVTQETGFFPGGYLLQGGTIRFIRA